MAAYIAMPTQTITLPVCGAPTAPMAHASPPVMTRLSPRPSIMRPVSSTPSEACGPATDAAINETRPASRVAAVPSSTHRFGPARSQSPPANGRVSNVTTDCAATAMPTVKSLKPSVPCT
jgi:hypothetical protein